MIQLREAVQTDDPFLFALFAENKAKDFAGLGLDEVSLQSLLDVQFRMRAISYRMQFPGAVQLMIVHSDSNGMARCVGHALLHEHGSSLRLVDLAIMELRRGEGLGTALLQRLQTYAASRGMPIYLQVRSDSPALRLYHRLGFATKAEDSLFAEMTWQPPVGLIAAAQPVSPPAPIYTAPAVDTGRRRSSAESFPGSLLAPNLESSLQPGSFASFTADSSAAAADTKAFIAGTLQSSPDLGGTHALRAAVVLALGLFCTLAVSAQGILTITPGPTITTTAGTGLVGNTGDNAAPAAATLASPHALAYDGSGNLFIADTGNHAVREILKSSGTIVTVAGTGVAGFSGDGGSASTAQLDTPTGLALDASGNLYIADSHNHRVRRVSNGVITTIAGTGTPGFSGDGGPAVTAQLALPSAVAIDNAGTLFIADTDNHRVRRLSGSTLTTIAGNGEELFAGDGGPALAASLDSPTGVAVDAAGRLYIADRHNQRIRLVDTTGIISSIAGSASTLPGSFSGDGGSASSATLSKPSGISLDSAGNLFIADTGNQRIRQVNGGVIVTAAGTGDQGFGGDGSPLTSAPLNAPTSVITDASGNLTIADTLDQCVRSGALPTLSFVSPSVGLQSPAQNLTLSNTGTSSLVIANVSFSGAFSAVSGGSCPALPTSLAPGASCTASIAFVPLATGASTGSVTVAGSGLVPQKVLLTGTTTPSQTNVSLSADNTNVLIGQTLTLTARVTPQGAGLATGTVSFYDGTSLIGTPRPLSNNVATLTLSTLFVGTHNLTATYSGDPNFTANTSTSLAEVVSDFTFSLTANSGGTIPTVIPGRPISFAFTVQPVAGAFNFPVTLSATGLPPGATVSFSPQSFTLGSSAVSVVMNVQTSTVTALLHRPASIGGGTLAFALLLLPLLGKRGRKTKLTQALLTLTILAGSGLALLGMTGCGTNSGFFGQQQKTYNIQVIGTAAGAGGATLQRVATVQLTVQ